jgi:hypothetical protein
VNASGRRRSWSRLGLLCAATFIAWGCVLSPSPDLPGAMTDGGLLGSGGSSASGGAPPSSGGAPCLLKVAVETWCSGDDLWVRSDTCIQNDAWSVQPCPNGCTEGSGGLEASCEAEDLGPGGIGGQLGGSP